MATTPRITLLTDFGTQDGYVAAMKGVILRGCPKAAIHDISHEVPSHGILAGSYVLAQSAPFFPAGTLHVVVVDPGVGSEREILYAEFGSQRYLVPDNGVISLISTRHRLGSMFCVRNRELWRTSRPAATFHGRDIFAPVAAALAGGLAPPLLGPPAEGFQMLDLSEPSFSHSVLRASVLHVDRFGNLATNVSAELLHRYWQSPEHVHVWCAGVDCGPVRRSFCEADEGELLTLINSMDLVEIAANQASAAGILSAGPGSEVLLQPRERALPAPPDIEKEPNA